MLTCFMCNIDCLNASKVYKHTFHFLRYLDVYKKYADLLNNKAEMEVVQFIKAEHTLDEFVLMINRYEAS